MSFANYVQKYNYTLEVHSIQTEDGYVLTYFRIQRKNKERVNDQYKSVVLLQHGFIDSSDGFITNS